MTIIAWDGVTLAADKQSTIWGYKGTATKIYRVPGGIVGFAGGAAHAAELLEWFRAGRDKSTFPKPRNADDEAGSLFITEGGEIRQYGPHSPFYEIIEDKFCARGSGRDYALAAMYLGKTAYEAVEVASALDNNCGKGINVLTLEKATPGA